ncbi:MAG: hypothetical protein ACMXYF_04885 [Candidatus Woesearchaeota archaeon]
MTKKIHIPIFWDVDLTITEQYQQIPFFLQHEAAIKEACEQEGIRYVDPYSYFFRCDILGDPGLNYLQRMVLDCQKGGIFEGLKTAQLKETAKDVQLAPGLKECMLELERLFKDRAILHHFFVSVGIKHIIEGIVQVHQLPVTDIVASEFLTDENDTIIGIKRVVTPFTKNQWIIGAMKGEDSLLNTALSPEQYRYEYKNMIVIGDGKTDAAKFAYAKKRGGTPVAVYRAGDQQAYAKTKDAVGSWVDFVLERDYTPGKKTFSYLCQTIEKKLQQESMINPTLLYYYARNKLTHPDEIAFVESFLKKNPRVNAYFEKVFVDANQQVTFGSYLEQKRE